MARNDSTQLPPAAPQAPGEPAPELVRLANRITLLTFLTAFLVVLGLALLPRTWAGGGPTPVRLAAGLPLLLAAGLIVRVRRLRAALRRARGGAGSLPSAPGASADGRRARPSDPRAPAPTRG